ncbi:leucine-rich repeat protein, partial [Enterococcus faecalis]|uniref:leucine-rich repeat protein n=1 Tax=Enterococcus faecalis TaxID=1351 RepID=UPI003D6B2A4B
MVVDSYVASDYIADLEIPEKIKGIEVTAIRDRAIQFANNLNGTLIIPSKVKYIGQNAFQSNYLTSIVFPESIEII